MNVLLETKECVWIGMDTGAARMSKGNGHATSTFDQIGNCTSIYEDRSGRVWLGTAQHGLYYWQNGEVKDFPDETLKKSIVLAIAEDREGQLWLGTELGLRCYSGSFQSNNIPGTYNEVRALLVDRSGALWVGTRGNGLGRFQNGAFSFFRKSDGLASDSITALFEDHEGSLWVGTREGLSQLSDLKFPTFSETEGLLPRSCHGVAASRNGGVWATLDRGVSWSDGTTATNFSTEAGLDPLYIKRAFEARNGDVYLIDGAKNIEVLSAGKIVARFPNENWPGGIVEDSEGIIVSTGGNLFRLGTNGLTPFTFKYEENPAFYWIYNLCKASDGGIWVASVNGVFHVRNGIFKRWGVEEGLSSAKVNWVWEDADGLLWAGLTTGMARIKDGKVNCFSRDDGLFDNYVYAIVPDDFGSLWAQSSRGIFRVSRQALEEFAEGRSNKIECTGYDSLEALKTIDTTESEATGCKTSDGRIWFPNPNGVVMIDPAHIYTNSPAPPVAPL
jgi:ligand-binding sensor domain-containing protein